MTCLAIDLTSSVSFFIVVLSSPFSTAVNTTNDSPTSCSSVDSLVRSKDFRAFFKALNFMKSECSVMNLMSQDTYGFSAGTSLSRVSSKPYLYSFDNKRKGIFKS